MPAVPSPIIEQIRHQLEAADPSPVDRGKQGTQRSLLVDGKGMPLGCVAAWLRGCVVAWLLGCVVA